MRPVRYPVLAATFVVWIPSLNGNSASRTTIMRGSYPSARGRSSDREERVDELVGVERDEVIRRLAEADELDGDAELGLDRKHDAALRGAVELGQHHAGDVHRLRELLRLHEPVLTRRRVEHEEHLGDLAGV